MAQGSVTKAYVDITVQNNQTWTDAYQFDPPPDADDPVDPDNPPPTWTLNGQNFRLDIKGNPQDTLPILSVTSAVGQIVVNDAINRIINMNVPEAFLNASLVPGCYFYDLIMFDNSVPAVRVPLMGGKFNYSIGITGG